MPIILYVMSTAIIPARVAQILPLEVFSTERGGRNAVTGVNGRVASDIELLELDEELRVARYELRVANDSPSMLTVYAYAVRGKAGERPVTCTSIAVLPHSGVAVTFELPLPFIGTYDRITVEMHGDGIDVSSDTIPPGRDDRLLIRRAGALAAAIVLTALLAFLGAAQPQILAMNVPSEALGGTSIRMAYEARGLASLEYRLVDPDGATVSQGATNPGFGMVKIALPAMPRSKIYTAHLETHNIFGGDAKIAYVRDIATPVPRVLRVVEHPAAISALRVDRAVVTSGEPITATLGFDATKGVLRLIDDKETVWSALTVTKPGVAVVRAPHVDREEDLRLALHVERGSTSADTQVGVNVVPATPKPLRFVPVPNSPLEITAEPVKAGDTIPLRATRAARDLHVSLQDAMGVEVEGFTLDGGQGALHAPQNAGGGKYSIIVTFTGAGGQETAIYPLVIRGK